MRISYVLACIAALAMAQTASAAPATVTISFSPEFQQTLEEELGVREGNVLQAAVSDAVGRALTERGVTEDVVVEVSIIDAQPNRPTMQQVAARPGLDALSSVSIGGAELRGVVRGPDGQVLSEVTHRRYNHSLSDVYPAVSTWTEARRAIRQFANKIADAYVAHAR
jgi:hypothetical protein